jgi:hypothetical protein
LYTRKVKENFPATLRNPRVKEYPVSIPRFIVPERMSGNALPPLDYPFVRAFILTCLTGRPVSLYDFEKSFLAIGA